LKPSVSEETATQTCRHSERTDPAAKGFGQREKSRRKAARIHARVASQRLNHHHKLSTRLVRENQAVAVESLNIAGLGRTRLARAMHEAGWGGFLRLLQSKAEAAGRDYGAVGRFEPTSQICTVCGARDGTKPLHIRVWECGKCDRFWTVTGTQQ
jgi:putative transposase